MIKKSRQNRNKTNSKTTEELLEDYGKGKLKTINEEKIQKYKNLQLIIAHLLKFFD